MLAKLMFADGKKSHLFNYTLGGISGFWSKANGLTSPFLLFAFWFSLQPSLHTAVKRISSSILVVSVSWKAPTFVFFRLNTSFCKATTNYRLSLWTMRCAALSFCCTSLSVLQACLAEGLCRKL